MRHLEGYWNIIPDKNNGTHYLSCQNNTIDIMGTRTHNHDNYFVCYILSVSPRNVVCMGLIVSLLTEHISLDTGVGFNNFIKEQSIFVTFLTITIIIYHAQSDGLKLSRCNFSLKKIANTVEL